MQCLAIPPEKSSLVQDGVVRAEIWSIIATHVQHVQVVEQPLVVMVSMRQVEVEHISGEPRVARLFVGKVCKADKHYWAANYLPFDQYQLQVTHLGAAFVVVIDEVTIDQTLTRREVFFQLLNLLALCLILGQVQPGGRARLGPGLLAADRPISCGALPLCCRQPSPVLTTRLRSKAAAPLARDLCRGWDTGWGCALG